MNYLEGCWRGCRAARRRSLVQLMAGVATLIGLAGAPAAGAQQPRAGAAAGSAALVFDGVTVIDVEQGKLLPDQRVVVEGNRIKAVGGGRGVEVPKAAQVVDAHGKYLIPGLWDMHIHTFDDISYPLLIVNGVTGIRDAKSPGLPLETMVQWWHEILAGTRVGPPRQLLTGEGSINDIGEEEIAERKKGGANFLKVYPFSYELARMAKRAGLSFGGHVIDVDATQASDSGISIIDHLGSAGGLDTFCYAWAQRQPEPSVPPSVARCQPAAEHLRRNNTWVVPTRLVESLAIPSLPSEKVREHIFAFASQLWSSPTYSVDWLRDVAEFSTNDSVPLMSILQRADMPVLAGTDALSDMWEKLPWGFALHAELATMVGEGLTPLNVLQSATINPAKMLRATDSLGTVAPGKLADLVLLDADPLTNITNVAKVRAVVANGRYFDRPALDRLFADVQAQMAKRSSDESP